MSSSLGINKEIAAFLKEKGISFSMEPVRHTGPPHTPQGCPMTFGGTSNTLTCPVCKSIYTYCDEHYKIYFKLHKDGFGNQCHHQDDSS